MDISLSNAIIAETVQARDLSPEGGGVGAAAERVLRPILGGDNVRVSSAITGDLQKLLAQVRAEQENKKVQLAHLQLSAVLGHLSAMADLTASQQAQVSAMQMQIDALEAAVARERTTSAERKKAIETKRQLESDAQDDLRAAEQAGDEVAVEAAQKRLAAAQAQVATLEAEIAKIDADIRDAEKEIAGYSDDLTALLAKLDYPALVLVLAAISISASDATPSEAKVEDDEQKGKKLPTTLDVVRESLEKAVEDIRDEIVEKRIESV